MRRYEWLEGGLLEVVWEEIGDSGEGSFSPSQVDGKRRGFYHGREGQSMGMVLELGRGGVDNVVYIYINLYHNHDSCM